MRLGSPHGGKMARQTVLLIKMKRMGKDERSYWKLSKGIEIHNSDNPAASPVCDHRESWHTYSLDSMVDVFRIYGRGLFTH